MPGWLVGSFSRNMTDWCDWCWKQERKGKRREEREGKQLVQFDIPLGLFFFCVHSIVSSVVTVEEELKS